MLEKLVQAAIITFLLQLLAGLSPHTRVETRAATQPQTMPTPIVSLLFPPVR
jgi:hypothetical protein